MPAASVDDQTGVAGVSWMDALLISRRPNWG